MLLRYPFSVAVVAIAFAVTGGYFLFLRPEYRPPFHGETIDLSGYPAPDHGWTWKDGTPGFEVGNGNETWNVSKIRSGELGAARDAARRAGVDPSGVRLLNGSRDQNGLSLVLAGSDTRGHTCLGAQLPRQPPAFLCSSRLASTLGLVLVSALPALSGRDGKGFPLFVMLAARGDVTRVVLHAPEITSYVHRDNSETKRYAFTTTAYRKAWGNWGTLVYSIGDGYRGAVPAKPWRVRLDFYGRRGLLASKQVALAQPGSQLILVH